MGPSHSLKVEQNLRDQGKLLVDLTWNDPVANLLLFVVHVDWFAAHMTFHPYVII